MQSEADIRVATNAKIAANRAGRKLSISIDKDCLPAEDRDMIDHRLSLIQRKTEAILTENYELFECTTPRLFVVLPETTISWDPISMFKTRFRLYFICECGEHTKPTEGSMMPARKIPNELHLSKHEGYAIRKPTELFKMYGPFLMLMHELIKRGTRNASAFLPPVATIDTVTSQRIEYSLKYLEKIRAFAEQNGVDTKDDTDGARGDLVNYLADVKRLKIVDLGQLRSYLQADKFDNLLGNMYRMMTADGHVKWVCRDHYRVRHHDSRTCRLRDAVNLNGGKFEEQLGRVEITLTSSTAAAEFFIAVGIAKGVLELALTLKGGVLQE